MSLTERNYAGIKTAVLHAEDDHAEWMRDALISIDRYPGDKFLAEELRDFAYQDGLPRPPNDRAWGGVIIQAKAQGKIRFMGERIYSTLTRRCAPVWRKQK